MYNLKVENNFIYDLKANFDSFIPSGASSEFDNQGSMPIDIPGMGSCLFIDLGDKKIEGYPEVSETWGVLIRFHTIEAYYRYEGQGNLTAAFDAYGTCTLSTTNGTIIPITLDELVIDISGVSN